MKPNLHNGSVVTQEMIDKLHLTELDNTIYANKRLSPDEARRVNPFRNKAVDGMRNTNEAFENKRLNKIISQAKQKWSKHPEMVEKLEKFANEYKNYAIDKADLELKKQKIDKARATLKKVDLHSQKFISKDQLQTILEPLDPNSGKGNVGKKISEAQKTGLSHLERGQGKIYKIDEVKTSVGKRHSAKCLAEKLRIF